MITSTITPKQQDLINLICTFRYLDRAQFQAYLKHKSPRQINRHLQKLTQLKYVKKVKDGTDSLSSHQTQTKPSIYCLGGKGIQLIAATRNQETQDLKNRYKDNTRSTAFINKYLLLVDIFLELRDEAENKSINLTFQTKQDYEEGSVIASLHPDAYVLKRKQESTSTYFIDIIDPSTQDFVVKRKIRSFIKAFVNNTLESETGENFPIILLILPIRSIQSDFARHIKNILRNEDIEELVCKLTTYDKLMRYGITGQIWQSVTLKGKKESQ